MNYRLLFQQILIIFVLLAADVLGAKPLKDRVNDLAPTIGAHPPNIQSQAEFDSIKSRYEALKAELDKLIEASPEDEELLSQRGDLQSMGHNFDYPGAWQGATGDFQTILRKNPARAGALIGLGRLWVNSDPSLAPKAEELFRAAQCFNGKEPLEEAQNGIFFAYYYQGKMLDAYRQSEYLLQAWPSNEKYRQLNETTRGVLARDGKSAPLAVVAPAMTSCKESAPSPR